MAFPTVQARNANAATANATTLTATMPASIAKDELLFAAIARDGTGAMTYGSGLAGWNPFLDANDTGTAANKLLLLYKVAEGGEGTLSLTTPTENWCSRTLRITGYDPNVRPAVATAGDGGTGTTNPNPPSLDPADWGTEDTLWLAISSGDGNVAYTVVPASYTNGSFGLSTDATTTNRCALGFAERQLNAASEDPGTFTRATEDWIAATVGIRPAPSPHAIPILRSSTFYGTGAASYNNTFTLDAGTAGARRLFVCVQIEATSITCSSVSYGGTALTRVTDGTTTATQAVDTGAETTWWTMLSASLPANGGNTLNVTTSGTAELSIHALVVENASQAVNVAVVSNTGSASATSVTSNPSIPAQNHLVLSGAYGNGTGIFTVYTIAGFAAMGRGCCVLPTGGAFQGVFAKGLTSETGSIAVTSTIGTAGRRNMSTIVIGPVVAQTLTASAFDGSGSVQVPMVGLQNLSPSVFAGAADILAPTVTIPAVFEFVSLVGGNLDGSGATNDASSTMDVEAGNLLIAWCKTEGGDTTFDVAKDTGSPANAFTFDAVNKHAHSNDDLRAQWGYVLSAAADTNVTFRMTLGAARSFRGFFVAQFRPPSGTVVAKDGNGAIADGTSTAPNSGNFSTTGDVGLALGGYAEYSGETTASEQIDGVAATEPTGSPLSAQSIWHRFLSAAFSNGDASATLGGTFEWVCGGIAFKAVVDDGSQTLTPSASAGSSSILAPTVAPGNVNLGPSTLQGMAGIQAPTLTTLTALLPSQFSAAGSVLAPTITVFLSPSSFVGSSTVQAPTVTTGAVNLAPGSFAGVASILTPTVTPQVVLLVPSAFVGAASILAPSISLRLLPSEQSYSASVLAPTITTLVQLAASSFAGVAGVQTPQLNTTMFPTSLVGTATILTPTVANEGSLSITPSSFAGVAGILTPDVTTGGVTLLSSSVVGSASFQSPQLDLVLLASQQSNPATVQTPTVLTGAGLFPSAFEGQASILGPVVVGAIVLLPAPFDGQQVVQSGARLELGLLATAVSNPAGIQTPAVVRGDPILSPPAFAGLLVVQVPNVLVAVVFFDVEPANYGNLLGHNRDGTLLAREREGTLLVRNRVSSLKE